jgi:hypothetical protein
MQITVMEEDDFEDMTAGRAEGDMGLSGSVEMGALAADEAAAQE